VSLSIENNPGGGTLNGTTTVAAVGGVATFSNLNISKAGQGYTLVASSAAPTPELTPATSAAFNVNKLDQAIEFEELPDKTYGDDSFEVAATTTSGSQVSFTSESTEICTVANSTVHIVAAGDCTIRASQAGDADHNAATFADRTFTVHKANAKVVVSGYDTVYDGQPHTAALVSIEGIAGDPDATVGTADLCGTLHTDAGSYPNDVWTFTGSENYNDSSGTVNNNISKAAVTITAGNGSATFDGTSKAPSQCSVAGPGYVGDLTCTNNPASVGPQANTYAVDSDVSGSGLTNFEIAKVN
jgi:hypothetical protein